MTLFLLAAVPAQGAGGDLTWTLAGTGVKGDSGHGKPGREAEINQPRSVFETADGGVVWAEPWSHRVRKLGRDGIVRTIGGTGIGGFSGDGGPAIAAQINFVHSAAPTPDGGLLLADSLNYRIRKISARGIISTVAGNGAAGYSGDGGQARSASINNPRGVVSLSDGSFLIPDTGNQRVRKVSAGGVITTVAGTGVQGFSGDGGPATSAQLSIPFAVAPTPDGGFLLIDVGNQRIRKVDSAGTISTVAGTGVAGFSGDGGPATSAQVYNPHNLVSAADGGFYIADASNERVRYVNSNGTITTTIGTGARGYTGDGGPPAAAQIALPKAVGLTRSGDLLIAEEQNNLIRFVGAIVPPANVGTPTVTGRPSEGQVLTAAAGRWRGTGPTLTYQWQRCTPRCIDIGAATGKTYAVVAADAGSALRVGVTGTNPARAVTAYAAQTRIPQPAKAGVSPVKLCKAELAAAGSRSAFNELWSTNGSSDGFGRCVAALSKARNADATQKRILVTIVSCKAKRLKREALGRCVAATDGVAATITEAAESKPGKDD